MLRRGCQKPKENCVELNVDAAYDAESGDGGTRAIIQDNHGFFLAA